jgi:hypothetical protein
VKFRRRRPGRVIDCRDVVRATAADEVSGTAERAAERGREGRDVEPNPSHALFSPA